MSNGVLDGSRKQCHISGEGRQSWEEYFEAQDGPYVGREVIHNLGSYFIESGSIQTAAVLMSMCSKIT